MSDKLTQILKSTGDKLSRLAGEVLQQTHEPMLYGPYDDPPSTTIGCRNSGCSARVENKIRHRITDKQRAEFYSQPCPILLTWPEAMKWRDWAVEKFGFEQFHHAIWNMFDTVKAEDVFCLEENLYWDAWITYAQPEHYIKAACLCVLEAK